MGVHVGVTWGTVIIFMSNHSTNLLFLSVHLLTGAFLLCNWHLYLLFVYYVFCIHVCRVISIKYDDDDDDDADEIRWIYLYDGTDSDDAPCRYHCCSYSLCLGTGNRTERHAQAGGRGTRTKPRAIGRDDDWVGRGRLLVVLADLSQRISRVLPAEIRLAVHYTRQCRLRRSRQLSWCVPPAQTYCASALP